MEQKIGYINNFAGVIVSLNLKKSPYLGVGPIRGEHGKFKLWLNSHKWCAAIPEGLTDEDAKYLQAMLNAGILVEGRHYLPPIEKLTKTVQDWVMLVKTSRMLTRSIKDQFIALVRKKQEGGYTAFEILTSCLNFEESNQRRADWILFLNEGLKAYDGPRVLMENTEDDPEAYAVTIDATGIIVEDSRDKDPQKKEKTKKKAHQPETLTTTQDEREKMLSKFLGDKI